MDAINAELRLVFNLKGGGSSGLEHVRAGEHLSDPWGTLRDDSDGPSQVHVMEGLELLSQYVTSFNVFDHTLLVIVRRHDSMYIVECTNWKSLSRPMVRIRGMI